MNKTEELADASVEVLEIMKYAPLEIRLKIPNKYRIYIKKSAEKSSHKFQYDCSKKLYEQNILGMTKKILSLLYKAIM